MSDVVCPTSCEIYQMFDVVCQTSYIVCQMSDNVYQTSLQLLHVEIVLKTKQPEPETSLVYDVFIRVIKKESAS